MAGLAGTESVKEAAAAAGSNICNQQVHVLFVCTRHVFVVEGYTSHTNEMNET